MSSLAQTCEPHANVMPYIIGYRHRAEQTSQCKRQFSSRIEMQKQYKQKRK